MSDFFLKYYNDQLSYLRKHGKIFAKTHPKAAGNLNLGCGSAEDPLASRLLESFAFLTARIQYNLEQGNHSITENLLNLLYPHYELPVPAFTIVKFEAKKNLENSFTIQRETELRVLVNKNYCTFRTCYTTNILPIKIKNIKWQRNFDIKTITINKDIKSCLHFQLDCIHPTLTFKKLESNKIRLFINLEPHHAYHLYEILENNLEKITVTSPELEKEEISFPKDRLKFSGFEQDEQILVYPKNSQLSYQILTEFFAYPHKFLFFDICDINELDLPKTLKNLQINFYFNTTYNDFEHAINDDSLVLNCCPIVNLFKKKGEALQLNQHQIEYHIVPDNDLKLSQIEVYSIESIDVATIDENDVPIKAVPYFEKKYSMLKNEKYLYWYARKRQCWELGEYYLPGTETFVAFSPINETLETSNTSLVIISNLLCTNREFTLDIPFDGKNPVFEFFPNTQQWIKETQCVISISHPRYRVRTRDKQMDLLTHININQFYFNDEKKSIETLKSILGCYNLDHQSNVPMIIKGIKNVRTKVVIHRNPDSLKPGFCQGIEYTLVLDEQYFSEHNCYLFAKVLQYFLQKSCSINSFVQMVLITKQRGIIKKWKPFTGTKTVL